MSCPQSHGKEENPQPTTRPGLEPSLPSCLQATHSTSWWAFFHISLLPALDLRQQKAAEAILRGPHLREELDLPGGICSKASGREAGMKADPQEGVAPESWQIKIRRASTVWRPTEDLRNPLSKPLSSWALEVIPMASPHMLLLCLLVLAVTEGWGRQVAVPGCHLHPFNVTVRSDRQGTCQGSHVAQACVGHCESSAFPSRYSVLVASGYRHNVTSVSQCCTISGLKKVKVQLQCGGDRREELEIFTARACQCDMCRLSRY